jgi:TonB family protein
MKALVFALFVLAILPRLAHASDAEGCADLKQFPRLEGCVIVECSARRHDPFDSGDGSGAPVDANTNALSYSCPAGNLQKMERDFDGQLRKAGYLSISHDNSDAASPALTARKGSQWIHWNASADDDVITYSVTAASDASEKFKAEFKAEACLPPALSSLKQCEVVECNSKAEDSVSMRTALKDETSLTGNVQNLALSCPAIDWAQTFSMLDGELKTSGFDILFSDREHPESAWLTGRAGKRWVELARLPGESFGYSLTIVPEAEPLTALKQEPAPVPALTTPPVILPVAQPPAAATPPPAPVPIVIAAAPPVPRPAPRAAIHVEFIAPKPVLEVQIEPTHDRIYSVMGDVAINMLVDVDENGLVTNAVLTGRITKDVLKLQSAALEAMSHWRFEPALQDGRIVAAVKIPVQLHFHGRPWRF